MKTQAVKRREAYERAQKRARLSTVEKIVVAENRVLKGWGDAEMELGRLRNLDAVEKIKAMQAKKGIK